MLRPTLSRAALVVVCTALVAHARTAATQAVPPPRRLVFPRAAPAPLAPPAARTLAALTSGWSDAQLRAHPWLLGQTTAGSMGTHGRTPSTAHDASLDEGALADRIAAAGRAYLAWGRVDDELRWAPWLCRQPRPSVPRVSGAEAGGHAQKVYFLYARDRDAYMLGHAAPAQVVVKESWTHRPVDLAHATQLHATPLMARAPDGTMLEPDRAAGLFVMMRVDARDPRADRGWVYGTVSPNGDVTSAGRLASCMGCHVEAGPGRLFGLAHGRTP